VPEVAAGQLSEVLLLHQFPKPLTLMKPIASMILITMAVPYRDMFVSRGLCAAL